MTTDIAGVRLRLSAPRDIVDAVPYLVGFQPEDSLVVVSLRGKRNRIGLTARVDLPSAKAAVACARQFVGYLQRDQAARAVVVLYPPSDGLLHPSVGPLAEAMTEQLARVGVEVLDVLCVYDGRWWSWQCTDGTCCPVTGTPVLRGGTSALAAAMAVHGQVVHVSRQELAHTLDPVAGIAHSAMAYALPRAQAQLTDRVAAGLGAEVAAESIDLFRATVRRRLSPDRADGGDSILGVDDAARLIVGLDDVRARDEILTWFDAEWGVATRGLLIELVRRAVPPYQVPTLAVLGWLAYLQGDGALAGIAIDRALSADPGYGLAQLVDRALLGALDPDVFRTATRALSGIPEIRSPFG